jgi:hypothetical protein
MKTLQERKIEGNRDLLIVSKKIQTWIKAHPRKATIVWDVIREFDNAINTCESELAALDKEIEAQPKNTRAEEWLNKNYHEFMIHWRNAERSVPFICNLLEKYAAQFKYDYSKSCECWEERTGETWCCNICGLPVKKDKGKTGGRNYFQIRDLTDEEWLLLPKEEILQLYKNCYKMLMESYAAQSHKEQPIKEVSDEEIENYLSDYAGFVGDKKIDAGLNAGFKAGAKWMRDRMNGVITTKDLE